MPVSGNAQCLPVFTPRLRIRCPHLIAVNLPRWWKAGYHVIFTNKTDNVGINVTVKCVRVTIVVVEKKYYMICVWPCIINVGKVIWKNQLDATIIYFSTRSAQHVSGNLLSIFRSVRLIFYSPCLPQQQDTICCKISVLRSWRWTKDCPKHVELIL